MDQLEINVDVQELIRRKPAFNNKDTQSIGTISMLDGIMFKSGLPETLNSKVDNKCIVTHDHDENDALERPKLNTQKQGGFNKALTTFRERISKLNNNKPLKIKAPSFDELIKKPIPIGPDVNTNSVNELSVPSKDFRNLTSGNIYSMSPNPNPGFTMVQPNRDPLQGRIKLPLVFSRGQTPEIKQ